MTHDLLTELFDGWRPALAAAVKALALFATVAITFRLTLRRTMAEFTPFDWVTAVAVGAIIGRTATSAHTSWSTGVAAVLALLIAHDAVARLRFIPFVRRCTDPPVRVLIRDGHVEESNLKRCRITHQDLDAILRAKGFRKPSEVSLALFESKGVSVFAADKS